MPLSLGPVKATAPPTELSSVVPQAVMDGTQDRWESNHCPLGHPVGPWRMVFFPYQEEPTSALMAVADAMLTESTLWADC